MSYVIQGYHPESVFRYFEEISAIPRASGNEKALSAYLLSFAAARGLDCSTDALHNVVIRKKGSAGCADLPAVMLQGHQDMVCEKLAGVKHDFNKDSLKLVCENGCVHAKGTTLGADNGVAVAFMLGLLDDNTLCHPPLECVFTTQEETGLYGAASIDGALISARTMINLDSEDEGIATVSCAGGVRATLSRKIKWKPADNRHCLSISILGLRGGHSGAEIHLGHANANKLLGRLLWTALDGTDMRLCAISGGSKDNAIPRESSAVLAFGNKHTYEKAQRWLTETAGDLLAEIRIAEPQAHIEVERCDTPEMMMSRKTTEALVKMLFLAPNGIRERNVQAGDFVVCSLNLGVMEYDKDAVRLYFSLRSSVESLQQETKAQLSLLAQMLAFKTQYAGEYPGWSYAEHSPIRDVFCESYQALFGQALKVESIHAGLECGLFGGKLPGLDAIAVGPTVRGVHTPDEELDLGSCERTWLLLTDVLKRLTQ